ncbi:hypothetical protein ACFVRD_39855 [Streptomyces sp. NPDC057908]|uniref:hypothetical protein n=1 Tax=Streptomyces sp. NPDC057908 TaxID=3346276 RepID=UPI0036EEF3DF
MGAEADRGAQAGEVFLGYVGFAQELPAMLVGAAGVPFGIVAATGTLLGLGAPHLTGHLIDAADTPASGYTTPSSSLPSSWSSPACSP